MNCAFPNSHLRAQKQNPILNTSLETIKQKESPNFPFYWSLNPDRKTNKSIQTSHIQRASLNGNSRRKSTSSIRNAKCRLSAPICDKCANISLSVSSKISHNACNCFITPVGPSIWKFSRWEIFIRIILLKEHKD